MNGVTLTAIGICLFAAFQKSQNPHYTFGGKMYRSKFWSSLFFLLMACLIWYGSLLQP